MPTRKNLTDLALAATSVGSAIALGALVLMTGGFARAQTVDASGVRSGGMVIDAHGVHGPGVEVTQSGVRTRTTTVQSNRRRTIAVSGAGLRVLDNHRTATLDCGGGPAQILGNENVLTLAHCRRLGVEGNGNHITATLPPGGEISVPGNRNVVRYTGERVSVSTIGTANRVGRDG